MLRNGVRIAAALLVGACSSTPEREAAAAVPAAQTIAPSEPAAAPHPTAPSEPEPTAPEPPGERMWGHYVAALTARDAILEGDLEGAREPLAWLAHYGYPQTLPDAWRPHAMRMQTAARVAQRASTPAQAARAVATMGAACGGCHMAMGKGPRAEPSGWDDEADDSLRSRMHRHAWAVERMWEGLTVPWERAYEVGALVLGEGKTAFSVAKGAPAQHAGLVHARLEALAKLARKANEATTWVERSDAFGDILATCTECHAALGVRVAEAARPPEDTAAEPLPPAP